MKRTTLISMFIVSSTAGTLAAQQIPAPHRISVDRGALAFPAPDLATQSRLPVQPTQWKRGALLGAVGAGAAFAGVAYFYGCTGRCLGAALAYAPAAIIPGTFIGALIGGLFPADTEVVGTIRGPLPGASATVIAAPETTNRSVDAGMPPTTRRQSSSWKGAILIGVIAGTAFGLTVATQAGDEGSERTFSDRLSDGLVAGAILAVPVTVIVAMLTSD